MALSFIANSTSSDLVTRRQQVECNVCRLEISRVGIADVMDQRSERGFARWRGGLVFVDDRCRMGACQESGSDRFGVSLDAANLPGKQHARMRLHLQRLSQECGSVEIGVAMNLAVAKKLRVLESGNQAEYTSLLAKLQVILKSHKVVGIVAKILAAQLNYSVGNFAGPRIPQAYRLHRAKAQSVATAAGDLFNGKTAFEIIKLFPFWSFDRLCRQ